MTEEVEIADKHTLIQCPTCQEQKTVTFPGYLFSLKREGIIKIQIRGGDVCKHEFIVFLDQKGGARSYEKADFELFNARTIAERPTSDKLCLEDLLDTIREIATLSIFRAFLFDYPVFVIVGPTDNPHFAEQVNDLMQSFFPQKMGVKRLAQSLNKRAYLGFDVQKSEHLVLDINGIITNSPWGEKQSFDYEKGILKQALKIVDPTLQAANLRTEMAYFQKKVEFIVDQLEKAESVYEDELKERFSKQFQTKVADLCNPYLLYIKRRMPQTEISFNKVRVRPADKLRAALG